MTEQLKKKYTMDLTTGPILKNVIIFSIPLVISSVLQLLFNAVDVMVVGKFAGDNSLAAVGANGPIVNLLINLFMGLSVGANVLVARYFAAKEEEKLSKVVHTAITVSLISGILLIVIGWFGARALLEWTQSPPGVIELATVYLRIYFFGMPATMIYNFGAAILRGVGDTKRPLYYLAFAGVINVVLNLIFVIILKMDVVGVGVATVISQTISAALVIRCLMQEDGAIRLVFQKMSVDPDSLWQMIKIGLPAGIQSAMFSLSNVVVQSSINSFGKTAIAANAAGQNIEAFLAVATRALAQATVSFVGQNIGARKYERIVKIVLTILGCAFAIDLICGNGIYWLGRPLVGLYTNSDIVVTAGVERLAIACRLHFIYACMDVMAGALRGMGHSVAPMIVSILGVCVFRVVWVTFLWNSGIDFGIDAIYWTYPMSWALTLFAHMIYYFIARRFLKRKLERI